jgi:phosphoglycerate dehydrogenase-like enzyme
MLTCVCLGSMASEWADTIAQRLSLRYRVVAVRGEEPIAPSLASLADAIVTPNFDRTFPPMDRLQLLQSPLAGVDLIEFEAVPARAAICCVGGHEVAVAEYVTMAMLVWQRQFIASVETFRNGEWTFSSRTGGLLLRELHGKTLGIVGYGRIGRAVADRAAAFGMRVVACNRSAIRESRVLAKAYAWKDLPQMLGTADFVLISCAATTETKDVIDRETLRAMKRDAVLINVARGECVAEQDLYAACKEGAIAGAVIDTWYQYPSARDRTPRPSRYAFDRLPNVLMTPHNSAWTHETVERRIAEIVDNLGRLAARGELRGIVRPPLLSPPFTNANLDRDRNVSSRRA